MPGDQEEQGLRPLILLLACTCLNSASAFTLHSLDEEVSEGDSMIDTVRSIHPDSLVYIILQER